MDLYIFFKIDNFIYIYEKEQNKFLNINEILLEKIKDKDFFDKFLIPKSEEQVNEM